MNLSDLEHYPTHMNLKYSVINSFAVYMSTFSSEEIMFVKLDGKNVGS